VLSRLGRYIIIVLKRRARMGIHQIKDFLLALLNLCRNEQQYLLRQVRREFSFLIEKYGYDVEHCKYLNAMYWVIELWSPTEQLGINISNEMGIAVFVMILNASDRAQKRVYLYLPVLVSYLTNNPKFVDIAKQGKIPLGKGALRWYANLLQEYYLFIASALRTGNDNDKERVVEDVKRYMQEEIHEPPSKLAPIDFKIDEKWEREGPCWVRKQ